VAEHRHDVGGKLVASAIYISEKIYNPQLSFGERRV
jgi:hypothetical protein